jgi:hypothetical protein
LCNATNPDEVRFLLQSNGSSKKRRAVVECNGPKELKGVYLVLYLLKTGDGWRKCRPSSFAGWKTKNSIGTNPVRALAVHAHQMNGGASEIADELPSNKPTSILVPMASLATDQIVCWA